MPGVRDEDAVWSRLLEEASSAEATVTDRRYRRTPTPSLHSLSAPVASHPNEAK
jgi:hypothetical protein